MCTDFDVAIFQDNRMLPTFGGKFNFLWDVFEFRNFDFSILTLPHFSNFDAMQVYCVQNPPPEKRKRKTISPRSISICMFVSPWFIHAMLRDYASIDRACALPPTLYSPRERKRKVFPAVERFPPELTRARTTASAQVPIRIALRNRE